MLSTSIHYLKGRTGASDNTVRFTLHAVGHDINPFTPRITLGGAEELDTVVSLIQQHRHEPKPGSNVVTIVSTDYGRCSCGDMIQKVTVGGLCFGWSTYDWK